MYSVFEFLQKYVAAARGLQARAGLPWPTTTHAWSRQSLLVRAAAMAVPGRAAFPEPGRNASAGAALARPTWPRCRQVAPERAGVTRPRAPTAAPAVPRLGPRHRAPQLRPGRGRAPEQPGRPCLRNRARGIAPRAAVAGPPRQGPPGATTPRGAGPGPPVPHHRGRDRAPRGRLQGSHHAPPGLGPRKATSPRRLAGAAGRRSRARA